jgi:hypothetical protein
LQQFTAWCTVNVFPFIKRRAKGAEMPARFIAVIIVILLVLVLIAILTWATIRLMRRHRFQFSLKTLLIFVTAVAVLLSVITSWNYWFKAQIDFLDPSSQLVSTWQATPVIIEEKGNFKVTYRPQHRGIGAILNLTEKASQGEYISSSKGSFDHMGQSMTYESDDRRYLEKRLATIQKNDVLQKGCFTIQGIIKDADENPVSGATVDLLPWGFVNAHQTRTDGTFFLPIDDPTKMGYHQHTGYYLRIRYGDKTRDTPTFSLDSAKPELFVIVHVR